MANVDGGDALPRREGFAGVIVTGSAAMVTERADWSERSADWLREAAHDGMPLFGICYGHQLLAHALGGEVGYNPAGPRDGHDRASSCIRRPQDDPLFARPAAHIPRAGHAPADRAARAGRRDRAGALRRRTTATPSAGASAPGACSSIPNSAPPTCAATCVRAHDALAREGRCAKQVRRNVTAAPHARKRAAPLRAPCAALAARALIHPPICCGPHRDGALNASPQDPRFTGSGLVSRRHRPRRAQSESRVRRRPVVHGDALPVRAGDGRRRHGGAWRSERRAEPDVDGRAVRAAVHRPDGAGADPARRDDARDPRSRSRPTGARARSVRAVPFAAPAARWRCSALLQIVLAILGGLVFIALAGRRTGRNISAPCAARWAARRR